MKGWRGTPTDPYTLILGLSLLGHTVNPNLDKHLEYLSNLIDATKKSMQTMQESLQTFHSTVMSYHNQDATQVVEPAKETTTSYEPAVEQPVNQPPFYQQPVYSQPAEQEPQADTMPDMPLENASTMIVREPEEPRDLLRELQELLERYRNL